MKEMTKYSRVAGYLEKLFDMLNADLFDGELFNIRCLDGAQKL